MNFSDLNLIEALLKTLKKIAYEKPTPIQKEAIPLLLQGKDILACAQTGTGKTAAFALPLLQKLFKKRQSDNKSKVEALILAPTRELAIQIHENITTYAKETKLKSVLILGGVNQDPQVRALKKGVDIIIATPGRLNDLINQNLCDLSQVSYLVLDEADHMLDMGFIIPIERIISCTKAERQTLMFSATMPKEIKALADEILKDPAYISVNPVSSTVDNIAQKVYFVDQINKNNLLEKILEENEVKQALVFTRTKNIADKVAKFLSSVRISSKAIHSNKSHAARLAALNEFKKGKIQVLVATDVVSRGIDIDSLEYVINYDLPEMAESYVHRIGRTARAGKSGIALSLCNYYEKYYLNNIEKLTKVKLEVLPNEEFEMQNLDRTNPRGGAKAKTREDARRIEEKKLEDRKKDGKEKGFKKEFRKDGRKEFSHGRKPRAKKDGENTFSKDESKTRKPRVRKEFSDKAFDGEKKVRKPRKDFGEEKSYFAENKPKKRSFKKDEKSEKSFSKAPKKEFSKSFSKDFGQDIDKNFFREDDNKTRKPRARKEFSGKAFDGEKKASKPRARKEFSKDSGEAKRTFADKGFKKAVKKEGSSFKASSKKRTSSASKAKKD